MLWLEHRVLEFPAYPHEITALQLHDSALLTLRIAMAAAEHGWILKDASAWNVLHSNGYPVFIDLLSFEPWDRAGSWIAYGQFVRHFLLPLLIHRETGMTPQEIFLVHRDGIAPEQAYRLLSGVTLASPAGLEYVLLPKLLAGAGRRVIAGRTSTGRKNFDATAAQPLMLSTMRRLQRMVERLRPDPRQSKSTWGDYEKTRAHYSEADLLAKTEFVRGHLGDARSVLDVGCNAGEFSLVAAETGRTVIAADSDAPALGRLYDRIREKGLAITPVLLNIGRPTPAIGWGNHEVLSFLDRSAGHFDCVMLLGLVHHLLVTERATIPMLVDMLHRLAVKRVIIEWVAPEDQKFRQLASINALLYKDLTSNHFEALMAQRFLLVARSTLPCGTRVMYEWIRN
jgi:SAM-dependent methyltransferase